MPVGKRIYLKRNLPDKDVMMQFKTIPASNTCDVMERNSAMNPRIRLMSSPKEQMMVGPALTVKVRGGDNLALHAALNIAEEGDVVVVSNEGDNTRSLMGEIMMATEERRPASSSTARSATSTRSPDGISRSMPRAPRRAAPIKRARARSTCRFPAGRSA